MGRQVIAFPAAVALQGRRNPDEVEFKTGYDKAAEYSYGVFKRLREEGVIPAGVRFQVCLPTPMASCYMYVSHKAYDDYQRVYRKSLLNALNGILGAIPHEDLCIQYDVCQEVLIFENYFPYRPPDYKERIFAELAALGDAVPEHVALGTTCVTAPRTMSTWSCRKTQGYWWN